MNTKYNIWLIALLIIALSACNEIPSEIPDFVPPSGDRKVLIEEFSGVQCPNCPVGAAQIENFKALYGDRIVAMTLHSEKTGILSQPFQDSKFDFRTEAADVIIDFLGLPPGIPAASIDRVEFQGENELLLAPNKWAARVEEELAKDAPVGLNLSTSYDSVSRALEIEVNVIAQKEINGDIRFHMGLIESGMIDLQIDGTAVIEEYEHNHILRTYLTDFKGDNISSNLDESEQWSKTYNFDLPVGDGWWIAKNMHVVGFVSNITENAKTVLQAEEVSLVSR